jgi:ribulose-phosphate 3-epimerase
MHPIRIAPSLLASDFANLESEIAKVEAGGADWLHVDVMDGHFVPNITLGPPVVASIKKVATKPLDVHLMIADPWQYADPFLDAGADVLTFHLEVAGQGDALELIERIKARGARAGMAINPDADVAALEPYLPALDMVLVMSVFPGFGGQSFMPEVLESVSALRGDLGFTGEIEMDGGVDLNTIESCAAAGTNVFVAGTAVFRAPDVPQRIADLRELASAARPALQ